MKIKKSQLEQLIKEAIKAQGGNEKTQQVIVESVKRQLNENYSVIYNKLKPLTQKYGISTVEEVLKDIVTGVYENPNNDLGRYRTKYNDGGY